MTNLDVAKLVKVWQKAKGIKKSTLTRLLKKQALRWCKTRHAKGTHGVISCRGCRLLALFS